MASAAESVVNVHLNSIDLEKDKKVGVIGKTDLSINVGDLPGSGGTKIYTCDLSVPADVKRSHFTKGTASSGPKRETRTILKKNDINGQLSLRINVL